MELEYFVVDVFTETALKGNPLAVVLNTTNLTTERMQAIAREFNLSETTFVERRPAEVERAEGVRVRIFTTQEELNFAGHPTLGTASVLKKMMPETMQGDTVTLSLNVGAVPVRFSGEGLFGGMTQRDPEFGAELGVPEVARLTGLETKDIDAALPPQVVSTGTAVAIVALQSAKALERLSVNQMEATPWLRERGARWFYVMGPTGSQSVSGEPEWTLPRTGMDCILGVDAGSTTTKAILLDRASGRVAARRYLRTHGNPGQAAFECIADLERQVAGLPYRIVQAAVTGSGREIVSIYLDNCTVFNEILAHARAAPGSFPGRMEEATAENSSPIELF